MQPSNNASTTPPPQLFPLLVPKNKQLTQYHGYIGDYECSVNFDVDSKHTAVINCSPALNHLLSQPLLNYNTTQQHSNNATYQSLLVQRLSNVTSGDSFFREMRDVFDRIQQVTERNNSHQQQPFDYNNNLKTTKFYKQILDEIDTIGWEKIVDLDTDLNTIGILIKDTKQREHVIHVNILKQSTGISLSCTSQLPLPLVQHLKFPDNRLESIIQRHTEIIEKLQKYFDVVDEIDKNTWVLEPERPNYAHTMRRIAIGSHSSIQIELNVNSPHSMPLEIRFLGADSVINPLRESYHSRQHEWNVEGSFVENLQHLLRLQFPRKTEKQEQAELSEECGICYTYRQENSIPDKVCDNPKCCMPFHSSCLMQWLRALQDSIQRFDTLSGKCPYCREAISVKIV